MVKKGNKSVIAVLLIGLLFIPIFSIFMPCVQAQGETVLSSIQDRVISQISDPRGDVPTQHNFIDIVEASILQVSNNSLQFEMKLNGSVPIKPSQNNVVYLWLLDTDQNRTTGQMHVFVGSEFNVRLAFYDGHWQGYVDAINPHYFGGRAPVFVDNDTVSIIVGRSQLGNVQRLNWEVSSFDDNANDIANSFATAEILSISPSAGIVSSVSLSPSFLRDGNAKAWLSVTLKDSVGELLKNFSSIKFFVDYPSMVSITDSGIVSAGIGKFGSCWITMKIDGILSQTHTEARVGSVRLLPPILLLSISGNRTGTLTLQVHDAYGNNVSPNTVIFSSGNPNVATVSNNGLVTAIRPPQSFPETPYVTGSADGIPANNAAVVRVTNDSLGLTMDGLWGKQIAYYVPRQPIQGFDYQKIFRDWDIVRITDLAYQLENEATGTTPSSGDIQFLVNDPGHGADGTVPCGLSGNPIRLGTDVDKPVHDSCMIVAYGSGTPQWGVYFHEMGHDFLGEGTKIWQFMPGYATDFVYSEGLATALGMYSAKMLQQRSSQFSIPQNILDNIISSVWHFGSTPDLNDYISKGKHYGDMTPSVLDDMIDVVCSANGYDSLYRFFSLFLPRDLPFTFSIDTDTKQATLFVAALSAATNTDLRTQFVGWGFPIDSAYYDKIWNEVSGFVNQRQMRDVQAPITFNNYDGNWHNESFPVTLVAGDVFSGVAEVYYKINGGNTMIVSINGLPTISSEGANNTLEYWSIDNADNEEFPHNILTGIRLDKTLPTGSIQINNRASYTNSRSVILNLTASDNLSGVNQIRFSNDGIWDTEQWEPPISIANWTLTSGDGQKKIYYQIMDNAGLISSYNNSIILDSTNPIADAGENKIETVNSLVAFDASKSTDNSGIVSYSWDFGDGTAGSGVTATHQYTQTGTYTVTLTVKDVANNSGTKNLIVTVEAPNYTIYYAIGIAAIVAIIAAIYFLTTRKRKLG